jgi:hypothetical protein
MKIKPKKLIDWSGGVRERLCIGSVTNIIRRRAA